MTNNKAILAMFSFLITVVGIKAQTIHYSYDAAGNRIAHYLETDQAQLRVTPGQLTEYSSAVEETIQIENLGNADLNWTAVSNNDWIVITGDTGGINNGTIILSISENTGGERYGSVTISANGALNSPYELNITQYKVNHAPVIDNPISDINRYQGFSTLKIDISDVFSDEDGDDLTYVIKNEDNSVALVSLTGTTLIITEVDLGITNICLTAQDRWGGAITDNFKMSVLDVNNNAPYLVNPLVDQLAEVGTPFSYIVPGNTFVDSDDSDSLSYSAELNTGQPLPDWLNFDEGTRTFSGTPDKEETLYIRVIATDLGYASAADIFTLTVKTSLSQVNSLQNNISVYPNPSLGILYLDVSSLNKEVKITVSDINGRVIISQNIPANKQLVKIDLSNYAAGIYIFTANTGDTIREEKIILIK